MSTRARKWWPLLVVLAGLVLAVPVLVVAALMPTSSSEAVAEETVVSAAEGELKGLPAAPNTDVQAAPAEAGGEPFRTCEVCHANYLDMPSATGDLIFSHPVHLDQSIKCATCHEPPLGHFSAPAPLMMRCLECHEGETAPNDCQNCHRKIDEIAPGLDEPAVHLEPDAKARKTCEKCHEVEEWCEKCHGVVMPHPAQWLSSHTEEARRSAQTCEKCHQSRDKTFCMRCHGVEMPHPAYWYSNHGDVATDNPDSCLSCHPSGQDFCDSCHHAGYQGKQVWVTTGHGQAVTSAGSNGCFICHEQRSCEECHETGRYKKN